MTKQHLNSIFKQAKIDVESGMQPADVSTKICDDYGLNWMFVAPTVKSFKK